MKFLHITDIHLDHLEAATMPQYVAGNSGFVNKLAYFVEYYNKKVENEEIDAILLTGDISTAKHLEQHLVFLESNIKAPIYFVLGNHDYYGDKDILNGKSQATAKKIGNGTVLTYVTAKHSTIKIDKKVAIIGSDGWYDGGYASMYASDLFMTDFITIGTFAEAFKYVVNKEVRNGDFYPKFQGMGNNLAYSYHYEKGLPALVGKKMKQTAEHFTDIAKAQLNAVLQEDKEIQNIVVLTHVAPFVENSIYKGKVSDSDWLPYFSNKTFGDFLIEAAKQNSNINFTVLCGHSHGQVTNQVLPNLVCHTTGANYGEIYVGRIIEF